ncbi:MAG: VCBS repeat-containing protein, partial [Cyclobacteriaceae bacterium]
MAANFLDPSDGCIGDCNGLELAAGRYIYSVNLAAGTLTVEKDIWTDLLASGYAANQRYYPKKSGSSNWTGVSVADFNQDGNLDVLMSGALGTDYSGNTTVFFWDFTNGFVDTYHDSGNNHSKGTGRLNIADVDNDGQLNINYVSNNVLYSLNENLVPLWTKTVDELSSGFTGCTRFDFDDDGTVETVYRSESRLIIIDGTDGSDRFSIPCVSRTQEEYPIVADVDGDGASEICVTCYTSDATTFDPYSNTVKAHVRVYEADGGESWQPSRPVWNQQAYFNVNVNDDLTIPQQQQDHSVVFSDGVCTDGENRALNQFMVQAPLLNEDGCSNYVSPDLDLESNITATTASCPETELDVSFSIGNIGDVAVSGTVPVSFYDGDPFQVGSTYLNTVFISVLDFDVGETQD